MTVDGSTVLVVDDDPSVRHTLKDILAYVGYRVRTSGSGVAALAEEEIENVDCVLADIRMHDMSGIQFCRVLKERCPSLPVILMTAYNSGDVLRDGMDAGAAATMTKPLDIEELLEKIRGFCTAVPLRQNGE